MIAVTGGRLLDPGQGLDGAGTVMIDDGAITGVG